jgi:CoA-transferase family III
VNDLAVDHDIGLVSEVEYEIYLVFDQENAGFFAQLLDRRQDFRNHGWCQALEWFVEQDQSLGSAQCAPDRQHLAALFAAGILAALVKKERTGQGCRVDVSLLSAAIDLQMESFTCYLNGERPEDVRQPGPIAGWYYGAPYGVYATKDGHVAISLGSLDALGDALGIPTAQRIPDSDAFRRRDETAAAIAASVSKLTTAECVRRGARPTRVKAG